MSITGSLVGYENNNDLANCSAGATSSIMSKAKNRSLLNMSSASTKQCSSSLNSSLISNSGAMHSGTGSGVGGAGGRMAKVAMMAQHGRDGNSLCGGSRQKRRRKLHLNALWSVWYGVLATILQAYLILHGAQRYLGCSLLTWKHGMPATELSIQIMLCMLVVALLPLFFCCAVFKVGNLSNDGFKLATSSGSGGKCSAEPEDGLEVEARGGTLRALWTHGGPTAAFIHIVAALCLLLPRLLLEARLIENGNLQREHIWRTELDFMVAHKDRLVVLSFMTSSPYQNDSNGLLSPNGITSSSSTKYYPADPFDKPGAIDDSFGLDAFNENFESVDLLRDETMYGATHLIEKFKEDTGDTDMFEKFKVPNPNPSSTSPVPIPTGSTATSTTTSASSTAITSTGTSTRKTPDNRQKSGRKTGGRKNHRNRGRGEDAAEPDDSAESVLPTKATRRDRNNSGNRVVQPDEDVDERLELQSNSKLDFGRLNEFEVPPVFESPAPGKPATSGGKRKYSGPRDSEIHVVKPDKSPELGASVSNIVTQQTTDSKIIEIKPSSKSGRKTKRDSDLSDEDADGEDELDDEYRSTESVRIEAAALIGAGIQPAAAPNVTAAPVRLPGLSGLLQRLLRVDRALDPGTWSAPPSLEFLNLALAILIWSARYPSVFWSTSKPFSLVFTAMLVANGIDCLLGFAGISVLYKLQIVGQSLPMHAPPLLLNAVVTIALFVLATVLTVASGMIVYLYGHGRLSARMRDRRMISSKATGTETWAYFAHCASLCFVLALAVVKASLMHDLSAAYRGSLDGAVLLAALGAVAHILLWVVMWLGLTAKRRWAFKLPPLQQGGGGSAVAGAAGLGGNGGMVGMQQLQQQQPLLVSPRTGVRLSHGLLQGSLHHGGGGGGGGGVEDIYWPKQPSSPKLKVTFNEIPSTSSDHDLMGEHDGKRNPGRRTSVRLSSPPGEADDGDYATLRGPTGALLHLGGGAGVGDFGVCSLDDDDDTDTGLLLLNNQQQHNDGGVDLGADDTSEEGKLLACVRDDSVTYASTRDLEPPTTTTTITTTSSNASSNATSPPPPIAQMMHDDEHHHQMQHYNHNQHQLQHQTSDDDDLPPPPDTFLLDSMNANAMMSPMAPVTVTVHANDNNLPPGQTPRCLRRADSGMPTTDPLLTPRSETTSSTESSTSPPERAPSETSSGVHSGTEEREEIYIRSRPPKTAVKPPQPAIQEEPFGRSTNMRMSSFNNLSGACAGPVGSSAGGGCQSSATLPLNRASVEHQRMEYSAANHCNTMPLPHGCHQPGGQGGFRSQHFQPGGSISASVSVAASPYAVHRQVAAPGNCGPVPQQHQQQYQQQQHPQLPQQHSTLPSAIRFAGYTGGMGGGMGGLPQPSAATANFLRRVPHVKNADSPYGILGLGAGHHTFSKLLHDPLMCHSIPEDRDSANYSMISDSDREMFAAGGGGGGGLGIGH